MVGEGEKVCSRLMLFDMPGDMNHDQIAESSFRLSSLAIACQCLPMLALVCPSLPMATQPSLTGCDWGATKQVSAADQARRGLEIQDRGLGSVLAAAGLFALSD